MTFDEIAHAMGVANRSVAAKLVARGRRSPKTPEGAIAQHQVVLHRMQLDLYREIMCRDLEERTWIRRVGAYLDCSKKRCQALGIYPRKGRSLRPAGPESLSNEIQTEIAETVFILGVWRYKFRHSPQYRREMEDAVREATGRSA
jgi:hypothetical protein